MNTSTLVAQQSFTVENSEYDGEFLEIWDDSELTKEEAEISELFNHHRESTKETERTSSPVSKKPKQDHRRSIHVQHSLKNRNPFKPRISSEVHVVSNDQQFVRKKSNQTKHTSDYKPSVAKSTAAAQTVQTTRQICERLNLHVRVKNPLANRRSVATQTTIEHRDCEELETKLKAAELKVQQLQQQLLVQ